MVTIRHTVFFIVLGLLFSPTDSLAQNVPTGKEHYQKVCKNCHGSKAQGMASFPKLAGRNADYLEKRLKQYRAGEKVGANSALMQPHAVNLSDSEIANIAAYIALNFD